MGLFTALLGLTVAGLVVNAADQRPLTTPDLAAGAFNHETGVVLDDALRTRIEETLQDQNVTGYSVGILRLAQSSSNPEEEDIIEFGQWGNRTEAGDPVTQNVRSACLWSIFVVLLT
jgi:hypothetical protein